MSKIGKKIIVIPKGVEVRVEENSLYVQGPKGSLSFSIHPSVRVIFEGEQLRCEPKAKKLAKFDRAIWGTMASLAENAVEGVTKGFEKTLDVVGVGYRAAMEGNTLTLAIGFSHPVKFTIPENTRVQVEKNTIVVSGVDKELVGRVAAKIRSFKKPEPYKGKGIKYRDEVIRRKAGKKVASSTA